jgi:very-short-patch-repair endonuclease
MTDLAISRTRQVFQFLKAYAERNTPVIRALGDYEWVLPLAELPTYPTIFLGTVITEASAIDSGGGDAGTEDADQPLMRIGRPLLTEAPAPDNVLVRWVQGPWADPSTEPSLRDLMPRVHPQAQTAGEEHNTQGEASVPRFEALRDDPARAAAADAWLAAWRAWADAERPARQAMGVFDLFYALYGRISRESERVELLLGDGRLRHGMGAGADHPILLQRVDLQFDPDEPEFRLVDADRAPELYTPVVQEMEGVSGETINSLRRELESGSYHPLGDNGTTGYLRRVANSLGADVQFLERAGRIPPGVSVTRSPLLFLRPRVSGMPAALDAVLLDLDTTASVPLSLSRVVGIDMPAAALSEAASRPVSPWGEPPDVLFSKEANFEQVRIARALEQHKAVLVQGPPGTGKSHTIANLIGHLVASGKRVLVTSHTTKALRVLRQHVVAPLRPLCVSLLDQDLEGRSQLEQAVRGIVTRIGGTTEDAEATKEARLAAQRERLIGDVERLSQDLLLAREAEYRAILVDNEQLVPAVAAREVMLHRETYAWLPGPLAPGAPIPLTPHELATLYRSNQQLTRADEREFDAAIPDIAALLTPTRFEDAVAALVAVEALALARFWDRGPAESEHAGLQALTAQVAAVAEDARGMTAWQRALVAAGCLGESERAIWRTLRDRVQIAVDATNDDRELLLQHEVVVRDAEVFRRSAEHFEEMRAHVEGGHEVGALQLLFRKGWKAALQSVQVNGKVPTTVGDFTAVLATILAEERRTALTRRWDRQAIPVGLPAMADVSEPKERLLLDFVQQFDRWLGWWDAQWSLLDRTLANAGFRWTPFRDDQVARMAPMTPLDRDLALITGPLQEAITARLSVIRRCFAERELNECATALSGYGGRISGMLGDAVGRQDVALYAAAYEDLSTLTRKTAIWQERRRLLAIIDVTARGWGDVIRGRLGIHGEPTVPADLRGAWRWRQLEEELDRRAGLDEHQIAGDLERARGELRATTIALIDVRAWLAQIRRTDLKAQQALIGWSDTQRKIGKGTGKRVPELQQRARELLAKAREAVPVWIMPLTRVAESFDPAAEKFDVVIVDEASQSDLTGLLAFYLGERVVVVGDHEQVSPSAVGQTIEEMRALQATHLPGIPNQHLYDGKTSIYDLARQSFGGTLALREHFRCVPDIIDFSNFLSYEGKILPLRDPATAMRPHITEHIVPAVLGGRGAGKVNEGEARMAAALIAAMCQHPAYADQSIGVISLLGDEQAFLIQERVLPLVGAVELDARRFAAGSPAQFQGDERHVILLSMVDSPDGAILRRRNDDPTKQRYNVAVSRARDQLWLLHSLDPTRDLQADDLRRRLIEHVRDPGAMRRALTAATTLAESPFERDVIERLVRRGYQVRPQVEVGHYRIDMVISDGERQIALECDGDRFHPAEQIPDDLARQAVLERTGWRFVRIRGSRFFRDPEAAMARVYEALDRYGIRPTGVMTDDTAEAGKGITVTSGTSETMDNGQALRDEITRMAWDVMRAQGWAPEPSVPLGLDDETVPTRET